MFFPGITEAKTIGFMIISRFFYIKPYRAEEKKILQKILLSCNQIILQKCTILMTRLVSKSLVTFSFISLVLKYLTLVMSKYFVSHLLFHIHEHVFKPFRNYFFSAQTLFVVNFIPQKTPVLAAHSNLQ